MGFGGISVWQLLIILAIIILIFGTKRLRNMGGDLGSAFKGFKKAVNDDSEKSSPPSAVDCLLYTSPSPRDRTRSRMPSSA